jgi:hypothetical protein
VLVPSSKEDEVQRKVIRSCLEPGQLVLGCRAGAGSVSFSDGQVDRDHADARRPCNIVNDESPVAVGPYWPDTVRWTRSQGPEVRT